MPVDNCYTIWIVYVAFLLPAGEYLCNWSFPNVLVYVISSHFGVNERKSVRFEPSSSRAYFQCTSLGCRVLSHDSSVAGIREKFYPRIVITGTVCKNFVPRKFLAIRYIVCKCPFLLCVVCAHVNGCHFMLCDELRQAQLDCPYVGTYLSRLVLLC